jgi:L-amino acid N-acyltransferase YncA
LPACYDYQAVAPAANAEAYQQQQNAQVGTAVAAGLVGAVAGAAIVGSTRSNRGYYRGGRGYYRGDRGHYRDRGYHRHGY